MGGNIPALRCAYAYYGADHLVLGTDVPFDMEQGNESIRETILAINNLDISAEERRAIFERNAKKFYCSIRLIYPCIENEMSLGSFFRFRRRKEMNVTLKKED